MWIGVMVPFWTNGLKGSGNPAAWIVDRPNLLLEHQQESVMWASDDLQPYHGNYDDQAHLMTVLTQLQRMLHSSEIPSTEIRRGADFIKTMESGGIASPTDKLEHLQFRSSEIQSMVECADNVGTFVTAHAYTKSHPPLHRQWRPRHRARELGRFAYGATHC